MGVNLDETETVCDLDPDPEVECISDRSHLAAGSRGYRRAVAGQEINPGVKVRIPAEGRLERERCRPERLDDLSAGNRTEELARVDMVCNARAQVRTWGGIDRNHKHRAGREPRAPKAIEAQDSADIHAVSTGEARRRVSILDDDHDARD